MLTFDVDILPFWFGNFLKKWALFPTILVTLLVLKLAQVEL
jgi:hypothetical protein